MRLSTTDVSEEVVDWAARAVDVDELEPSFRDRWRNQTNGRTVVVKLRTVGPDNSGNYRNWFTCGKAEYLAATTRGAYPEGYVIYHLLVGLAPDGRVWWGALYDEGRLPWAQMEPMHGGDWYRLPPREASQGIIGARDFINATLWEDLPEPEEPPALVVPSTLLHQAPIGARVRFEGTVRKVNPHGTIVVDFGPRRWSMVPTVPAEILP